MYSRRKQGRRGVDALIQTGRNCWMRDKGEEFGDEDLFERKKLEGEIERE